MQTPLTLLPRLHDLGGGFVVRRLLPAAQRQSVGPFVFFDHFGPVQAQPGDNHDVRPHPHIGLSTVTYLFEGAMLHRDSTGAVQRMEPGQLNWMTAGRGIVHSERTPADLLTRCVSRMVCNCGWPCPPSRRSANRRFSILAPRHCPNVCWTVYTLR